MESGSFRNDKEGGGAEGDKEVIFTPQWFRYNGQAFREIGWTRPYLQTKGERMRLVQRMSGVLLSCLFLLAPGLYGGVYNLRIVTDASPDYHDLDGMIRSITS